MSVALTVGLVLLLLAVLAAQFLVFPALWIGFRDQWRRTQPEKRLRGIVGGALATTLLILAIALSIAQPWGPHSIVYVILIGGGALALFSLAGVAVQAIREIRHTKRGGPS